MKLQKFFVALIVAALFISPVKVMATSASSQDQMSILSAKGTYITNEQDQKVILKGCNLGNWFALEMWMLHIFDNRIPDQYTLENILTERFGNSEKQRLMDVFRQNWIVEQDYDIIKSFGMNCVRLPLYHSLIEDENNPETLRSDAWKWLDFAVAAAEKRGIYTIIGLHGAAGGQSDMGHCGRVDHARFWGSDENKQRTNWLWQQIAKRYKDRPSVAGYDILNEPWGADMPEQNKISESIYKAIRAVDSKHLIFIQGHGNVDGLADPKEKNFKNVVYSAHCYPGIFGNGRPTRKNHTRFLKVELKKIDEKLRKYDVPFLMGEFNALYTSAGGAEMMRHHYDTYENYGWAATMWSYKVLTIPGEERRAFWEMVTNEKPLPNIDFFTASIDEIESYFKFLSSGTVVYEDLRKALTQSTIPPLPDPPPPAEPITSAPANDKLVSWQATDIGSAIKGGQKVYSESKIDLYGYGADIYNLNDQFRFIWKKISGDCEVSATVNELSYVHMFSKAGIMIRQDLTPNSIMAMLNIRPAGEIEYVFRSEENKKTESHSHLGYDLPGVNLKLVRKGQAITSFHCGADQQWKEFITITSPDLPPTVYVGIFCLSHDNSQLVKAGFDNIKAISLSK
jgi:endoglucanase